MPTRTSNIHPPGVPAHYVELVQRGRQHHEVRIIESDDSALHLCYLVVDDPADGERVHRIRMARRGLLLGSCWPEDETAASDSPEPWLLDPRDSTGACGERQRHASLRECIRADRARAKDVLRERSNSRAR